MKDRIQSELELRKRRKAEVEKELWQIKLETERAELELVQKKTQLQNVAKAIGLVEQARKAVEDLPAEDLKVIQEAMEDPKTLGIFSEIKLVSSIKDYDVLDELMDDAFKENSTYAVEKKYPGKRVTAHKKGMDVKIMDEQGHDLTKQLVETCYEITKLNLNDFVIDATITQYDGRKATTLMDLKDEKFDEKTIILHVHDIPYFGGDVRDLSWVERRKLFEQFNWTGRIKESAITVVDDREKAKQAVQLVCGLSGSTGALLKKYDSKYENSDVSPNWYSFSFEATLEETECEDQNSS